MKREESKSEYMIDSIVDAFQIAIRDIESLNEFYYRSNKTLIDYRIQNESNYLPGKKIADLFDEIVSYENLDERNKKIEEVNSIEISSGIKVSDVCSIIQFADEKDTLQFYINKNYKNKTNFSPVEAKRKYDNIKKYEYILIESILSHIVVSFENYLSDIYRILLTSTPLVYFENQTILLADVFKDNFHEAIFDKLESEINNKMRNSLDALEHISKKEEININRYGNILDEFKEVYYRRNAYVHTMGCANKDYMKKVNKKFLKNVFENEALVCDDTYLSNAIIVLCKLIFSIAYELLVKLDVSGEKINIIADYFFEKMKNKEYELAKYVYYALSQYKSLAFNFRTIYRINYINAVKQLNDFETVNKELSELDISIATDNFKIAKECLSNNYEAAYKMLEETYPKSFDAVAIREWPIFIDFRETEFYEKFVEKHKDDFDIQQVAVNINNQTDDNTNNNNAIQPPFSEE